MAVNSIRNSLMRKKLKKDYAIKVQVLSFLTLTNTLPLKNMYFKF